MTAVKQLVLYYRTGALELLDVPAPQRQRGHVLVRNLFSVVSPGTERAALTFARQNLLGKAQARPDLVRQALDKVRTDGLLPTLRAANERLDTLAPLGYSSAGVVMDVGEGAEQFQKGTLVACGGGGYACHAEVISVPVNLVAAAPDGVSPREAAFATLGAVAMQGIRRAELTPGERVGVIGLGLVGQLTVQILRAYGFPVLGLDVSEAPVAEALERGMEAAAVIGRDDVAAAGRAFTGGVGLDAVIVTASSESDEPLRQAGELCRAQGRVSVVGAVGMKVPRDLYYDKELDLRVSRSYGPGRYDPAYEERGVDYPVGYVRWTEQRNMAEFLRLLAAGKLRVGEMVTHTFPIAEAQRAYDLLVANKGGERVVGVVLEYPREAEESTTQTRVTFPAVPRKGAATATVGLIGGGVFARGTILPVFKNLPGVRFRGVATASGRTAAELAKRYGFGYAASDYRQVLDDPEVNLVVLATRHNLHARLAVEALRRGKHVHVEKPLALTVEELREVVTTAQKNPGALLFVGFNRRFAPMAVAAKASFAGRKTPMMVTCRVNAGALPADHWAYHPDEGGGRIIGEGCHFVDLLQYLVGAPPVRVYATSASGPGFRPDDNVQIALDYADGSRGQIVYTSLGSDSFPKERLEVFADGKVAVIDNFRTRKVLGVSLDQDKGHAAQFAAEVKAVQAGGPPTIALDELAMTTLVTFKAHESLQKGAPVALDLSEVMPRP
ncbi:MAG: oxidoreductase [Dehalococcoidia bacterium]|nr:oxidoreductase [Dehalococcoidia bacterium]